MFAVLDGDDRLPRETANRLRGFSEFIAQNLWANAQAFQAGHQPESVGLTDLDRCRWFAVMHLKSDDRTPVVIVRPIYDIFRSHFLHPFRKKVFLTNQVVH